MAQVKWMPSAIADLNDIGEYIARDDPDAADRVTQRIWNQAHGLGKGRPHATRWEPAGRELVVGAYCIQYRIVNEQTPNEEVQILSVPHGRQQH